MDILYACNEKVKRNCTLEAIYNKIFIINNIVPQVKIILVPLKQINDLKNDVYLLFDKIWKIVVFK